MSREYVARGMRFGKWERWGGEDAENREYIHAVAEVVAEAPTGVARALFYVRTSPPYFINHSSHSTISFHQYIHTEWETYRVGRTWSGIWSRVHIRSEI